MKPVFMRPVSSRGVGNIKTLFDEVQSGLKGMTNLSRLSWLKRAYSILGAPTHLARGAPSIAVAHVAFALGYLAAKNDWPVPEFPPSEAMRSEAAPPGETATPPGETATPPLRSDMSRLPDDEFRKWAKTQYGLEWARGAKRQAMESDVREYVKQQQAA